jgi:hypothetical protein
MKQDLKTNVRSGSGNTARFDTVELSPWSEFGIKAPAVTSPPWQNVVPSPRRSFDTIKHGMCRLDRDALRQE